MANSGTVTAGSAALASQYNNLRDDVLNVSTGHTHTGASEDGKQVEGTAIASTGATAGYVLTAGTGGTATTWQPAADSGAFATASMSFSFSSANDNVVLYTLGTAVVHGIGVGGAGTVLATVQSNAKVTPMTFKTYAIPSHASASTVTASATASIAPVQAGTSEAQTTWFAENNQASSTSVYFVENVGVAGGLYYTNFRKYTTSLATNQWSANIDVYTGNWGSISNLRYIPELGAWIGASWNLYYNTYQNKVFVINDTSGSVYNANFPINTAGTQWFITDVAYVPPVGAGNGTVYAFGTSYSSNNQRIVTYTIGSASITAASTVTAFSSKNIPTAGTTILSAYYDSEISKLVVVGANGFDSANLVNYYQFDRTFTTLDATSVGRNLVVAQKRFGNYAFGYEFQNSDRDRTRGRIGYFGAAGTGYAPSAELLPTGSTATTFNSLATNESGVIIAPGGTVTAYRDAQSVSAAEGGTASTYPIARKRAATASFGTATTGRMVWGASTAATVVSTTVDGRITMDGALAYLPAGSIITQVATDATATGTATNTFYTIGLK